MIKNIKYYKLMFNIKVLLSPKNSETIIKTVLTSGSGYQKNSQVNTHPYVRIITPRNRQSSIFNRGSSGRDPSKLREQISRSDRGSNVIVSFRPSPTDALILNVLSMESTGSGTFAAVHVTERKGPANGAEEKKIPRGWIDRA